MTDPIANLIAAALKANRLISGMTANGIGERRYGPEWGEMARELCSALAAAEARPVPKPNDACDFYEQLPKGPTHGRFSASDRAELGDLKRKAFEAARPEPAAEPSRFGVADLRRDMQHCYREHASIADVRVVLEGLISSVEALAREVRR